MMIRFFQGMIGSRKMVAILILVAVGLTGCFSFKGLATEEQEPTSTPPPTTSPSQMAVAPTNASETAVGADAESWLRMPDVAADATQAEVGSEIYRLVCSTCHGGTGQGLTEDWLATMAEENRNCWQSKCHASNHPPDGFVLPQYVPPVVGPIVSARFDTALDLFTFIRTNMPYQAPGTLLESEYWQLTAYILDLNEYEVDGVILDAETAAAIELE